MKNLSGSASNWIENSSINEKINITKKENVKIKITVEDELKTLRKIQSDLMKKYNKRSTKDLNDALIDLSDAIRALDNLN
jgi:uncharacterized protein YbjQ (UPF0145 family)